MSYLRDRELFFVEGIINEDLIFGFECVLNAPNVCFFNGHFFYRQREGSISHPKTFDQHKIELLFKSYLINFKYILGLYSQERYKSIEILLKNCLIATAQMPVLCWIKDKKLCKKEELKLLIPFMKIKIKIAYFFPFFVRIYRKIKKWK